MQNVLQTVVSQYANSPTLLALIQDFDRYIDPTADIDNFYNTVWNVDTAQGFGLDIWGRIVNVSRELKVVGNLAYFGFSEAYTSLAPNTGPQPFGQAPLYPGVPATQVYALSDDAYRKLILAKAIFNISDCSIPAINQLLQNLFAGRGRCYVTDAGHMEMRFVFEFVLLPFEVSILTQSGVIPRPAGVYARAMQIDVPGTFGFSEGKGQPFGSGVFFNSSGMIDVN
jgi:hypothetical protein